MRLIGDGIASDRSSFRFDASVAEAFDAHVRRNVPFYDEAQDLVAAISDWYLGKDGKVLDLGCATGETSVRIARRHAGRIGGCLRFTLVDVSSEMLATAVRKLDGVAPFEVVRHDLAEPYPESLLDADFAVMAFTLQFLPVERRLAALSNVRAAIRPGGALALVEKVEGEVSEFERIFLRLLDERKVGAGMSAEEVLSKEASIRGVLNPLTLNENIRLLHAAGFEICEVFWRWLSFVGIIATWGKSPSASSKLRLGSSVDSLTESNKGIEKIEL